MNSDIFFALAQSLGRLDLAGPLSLGYVATDLFALSLGLKRPSSLFKKLEQNPAQFPPLYSLTGTRRKFFKLKDIEAWHVEALSLDALENRYSNAAGKKRPHKLGRPRKGEKLEATRRGISIRELRQRAESGAI